MRSLIISTSLISIFCMFVSSTVHAQSDSTTQHERVYDFVEQMPEFPGGLKAMYEYLAANIDYPQIALDSCVTGTVYLKFIVQSDGTVSDVTVLRDIGAGCGEEAVRVVSAMPKWLPGKQNGKPVDVYYKLPIKYTLDDKCNKKKNK